ncbi:OLC1v1030459C1 [Oldenlandia corymbosa var. corymbosa]|uniref:OLC1v1030459C1 n=1 Tax=Oldenlandia corymbosa var. corymbosa TaxID=529605 RepID=A0AAV1CGW1_OLDCO|nr:OLC1v1030459C1 [Oldenlandia corymbosa var. corymbosa]
MQVFFIFFLALFLFLPSLLLLRKRLKSHETQKPLPPGPAKLPFIGNLHQMFGSLPHHTLRKLSQKYGPLMHLQLGELSTVVVSSPKFAKEVLQTNGLAFANRPKLTLGKIFSNNCLGFVAFVPYGDHWRQMRQIYAEELLNAKSMRSSLSVFEDELSKMVLLMQSQKAGKPIILGEAILSLNSTICRMIVGRKISGEDQEALTSAARETGSLGGVFNLADIFPSSMVVKFIVAMKPYKLAKLRKKIDGILE